MWPAHLGRINIGTQSTMPNSASLIDLFLFGLLQFKRYIPLVLLNKEKKQGRRMTEWKSQRFTSLSLKPCGIEVQCQNFPNKRGGEKEERNIQLK